MKTVKGKKFCNKVNEVLEVLTDECIRDMFDLITDTSRDGSKYLKGQKFEDTYHLRLEGTYHDYKYVSICLLGTDNVMMLEIKDKKHLVGYQLINLSTIIREWH